MGEVKILKMQEINSNMFLEKQQEDMILKQEDQVKEKSVEDNIQVTKNVEVEETKKDKEIDEKIAIFLYEKDLNENLIEKLIDTGLTDEYIRLAGIDILDLDILHIQN